MFRKTMLAMLVAGAMLPVQAAEKLKVGFLSTLSGPGSPLTPTFPPFFLRCS